MVEEGGEQSPPEADADNPFEPVPRDLSHAGDEITVMLGSERIQAVQYNTCELGALEVRTVVREDETLQEAHTRCMLHMEAQRERDLDRVVDAHLDHIERAQSLASKRGR